MIYWAITFILFVFFTFALGVGYIVLKKPFKGGCGSGDDCHCIKTTGKKSPNCDTDCTH